MFTQYMREQVEAMHLKMGGDKEGPWSDSVLEHANLLESDDGEKRAYAFKGSLLKLIEEMPLFLRYFADFVDAMSGQVGAMYKVCESVDERVAKERLRRMVDRLD